MASRNGIEFECDKCGRLEFMPVSPTYDSRHLLAPVDWFVLINSLDPNVTDAYNIYCPACITRKK